MLNQKSDAENIQYIRINKNNNIKYLNQIQKFLDIADNIKDENLKQRVIIEMLKCDEVLTQIMEDMFNKNNQIGNNSYI